MTSWTPASDDKIMFADTSNSSATRVCDLSELPVSAPTSTAISSAVSVKADDNEVVHTTLNETIAWIKTFISSPVIPEPSSWTDACTKNYADNLAITAGSGNVIGAASSTDNALVRMDGTWGKTIQNSGATLDDSGNVTFVGKIQQNEATARSWGVSTRTGITTFPVPSFRPTQSNSVIALDIMPNWTPSESPSNWYAWIDVCDADILTGSPATQFARFGMRSDAMEIGTKQINGGAVRPIDITINSSTVGYITSAWDWIIGNSTTANAKLDIKINGGAASDTTYIGITDSAWSVGDRKRVIQTYSNTTLLTSIDAYYPTGVWVDWRFAVYNSGRSADAFVMNYQWRFGIWTASPSFDLAFSWQAAKTIGLERHTTSNTAWSALTISAGSATSWATNKNGGGLVLAWWVATGTWRSDIGLQVSPAWSSWTSDNALVFGMYMFGNANGKVLFGDSSAIADTQDGINVTGQGAKYLYMKRHLTSNTAWNNFVVQAGWATSGATDKDGGDLALLSGISTGSGDSNIVFYTATAWGSGTTDRTPTIKMTLKWSGVLNFSAMPTSATWLVTGDVYSNAWVLTIV